jgi:iron complex outermembrane receptor protein
MCTTSKLPLVLALSALPVIGFAQEPVAAPEPFSDEAAPADPFATESVSPESVSSAEEPAEAAATGPRNRLVEEVVVTAQKREENLQDVPISITAFSAAALDAKGIDDPKALAQSTPGVYYGQTVNFAIIYIRGVGSDAFLPDSDPSVASYIDGIYFPFANGLSQSFGAVERVEVLKGPQGTLFGRNSTGGAFNTITKAPGYKPESSVLVSYGDYAQLRTRVYMSIPFTDTFAASVSVTYNNEDNYYEGTRGSGLGTEVLPLPKEIGKGARLKTRWDITDNLQLNLAAFKYVQDGVSSSAMPNTNPSLLTTTMRTLLNPGEPFETRPYHVAVDVPGYFAVDNEVYYGQLNFKPEWFDVKLLSSYQHITTDNVFDFDGTDTPFVLFDARGQFAKVNTAELQFLSNGEWGPDWLTWIVGGFYLDQESGFPLNRFGVAGLELSDLQLLNLASLPAELVDFLSGLALVPDGVSLALTSELGTRSSAYFTQVTADITDELHLTLEIGRASCRERVS